ncbi:MAG: GAF domain-containing protein [Polyangiaceae bacterium]|nr:GAF domain-containing protein [Polyangiaceae bacterium]
MKPPEKPRAGDHANTIRALVDLTRPPSGVTPPLGMPAARAYGESVVPDGRLASYVRATIENCDGLAGLADIQVSLSPHSRASDTETRWVTLHDWFDDNKRAELVEAALSKKEQPFATNDELAWVLAMPIQRRGSGTFGQLIAIFETEKGAKEAENAIDALVEELALGLALRRQALATDAATELSSALAEAATHQDALRWMTDILCMATRSDGAKVHVLRRTPTGPRVELLYRTDKPESPRTRHGLSRKLGFVDWVLAQNDWALFPARGQTEFSVRRPRTEVPTPPSLRSVEAQKKEDSLKDSNPPVDSSRERPRALTGRNNVVPLVPRDDADMPAAADGRPLLIVPLRVRGRVLGALSLWRNTADLYDADMDRPLVEMLGRHVASACRWLLHWEVMQKAVAEVSALGRVAATGETSVDVYTAVCGGVGRLAQAARTVLLLLDGARDKLVYYGVAMASALDDDAHSDATVAKHVVSVPRGSSDLVFELQRALGALHVPGREGARFSLRFILPMGDVVDAAGAPAGIVALYDQELPERERRATVDDGFGKEAAATFLSQVASIAWGSYPQAFAQKVARELVDPTLTAPEGPEHVLGRAADLLLQRTGADAVLVYRGDQGRMVVASAAPERSDLVNTVAGTSTTEVLRAGRMFAVRDASDLADPAAFALDQRILKKIANAYGWTGVRSWLCYPLIEGGRTLGLLKLLTRDGGRFLDPCATVVMEVVAARAAVEIRRMNRTLMLAGLNQLAHDLGGKERFELAKTMGEKLEKWARRFIQPRCHAFVVSTVRSPEPRLFALCTHLEADTFDADNAAKIGALCDQHRRGERCDTPAVHPPWIVQGKLSSTHQMMTGIDAPGNRTLVSWLVVTSDGPFSDEDLGVLREAARELSIFLDHEHRRHGWEHQVARFRHAIIGPMQGLTSAARMLAHYSTLPIGERDADHVRRLTTQVEEEAESTRLWRENQRIYTSERVEIVPKTQPLKPVIEKCAKRFKEILQRRGIGLNLTWKPTGSLDFPFDAAALDLVVTNLLDNARKYAFYNRDIELGVEVDGASVRIWVEDVGHAIPDRLSDSIYRVGERLDWKDPIRAIDGTGLGLPMARAVVESHGGTIRHTSKPVGMSKENSGEIQAHRVRFVVELPHLWRHRT